MFYQSTTVKEKILREVSEFLERYFKKEYDTLENKCDEENKTKMYEHGIMSNELAYYHAEKGCAYITESGHTCLIKLKKDYEIYISFDWKFEGDLKLHLVLNSYRIGAVQPSDREKEYTSYFYSDKEKRLSERIEDELISDLKQALKMKKEDWKRMEEK